MTDPERQNIESSLHETRVFPPRPAAELGMSHWVVDGREDYREQHRRAIEDPERFWGAVASELDWFEPFSRVLDWKAPDAKWFDGGVTNVCHNALDRQIAAGHGDEVALIWEGEPTPGGQPEVLRFTYRELHAEVCRFARALDALGVKKGDVVTIYMGMVPELAIAVLACARIGAPHSVIFGGFSAQAIVDRVQDASSQVIVTCDGSWRRGGVVPLKANVDQACATLEAKGHPVRDVVVVRRVGNDVDWHAGRDKEWSDLVADQAPDRAPEPMAAEDMLFLLYTSGSTGKPKGIVHTTGGYMVWTYFTARATFNLLPDEGQVYWCTADIGWITGHSYILYGLLPNRVPTIMYEGAPNAPDEGRFWEIIERHKVTHFYTAPTAIRAFMKWGDKHVTGKDLSSLKVLGTVGEPINPEAWAWYHRVIGRERCPIVDTWWQTETGGHMLTPLPGVTATKPGSCTTPMIGVDAAIVDAGTFREVEPGGGGLLVIRRPWPGMLRGIHGDRQRFVDTYWHNDRGYYVAGDGARQDEDGFFWIMGRVDDVINVSGHRIGTMEVESALVGHPAVVEAAVVGMPHEIKGTGIAAFCTLEPHWAAKFDADPKAVTDALRAHVAKEIGPFAKPDALRFADGLPKTRSGKIMRRLLRDVAAGIDGHQDTTTLEDRGVLENLRACQVY
ncbi:acetate--CoA ligase [Engelhardtia mirabilis]|uniref:Acetate--CoA ligase n=1 Tax=Engelhardtia mirabilis TaxID=2528011 RepID=A0A518BEU6_9BACT|nr:Acetyl-coenzyme A ligase [Planctomycetes bacterium Pla133]QDU99835.1 Acetyl-coenzyme A ligase [Planctomycetes bacterium Pla86]